MSKLTVHPAGLLPLEARRLVLERIGPAHASFLHDLLKEPGFWRQYRSNQNRGQSLAEIVTQLEEEHLYLPQQLQKIEWAIVPKGSVEPIGLAALAAYQPEHKRAELLIGIRERHASFWAAGLEAGLLVLDFAFNSIKLNKLTSIVYGYNEKAQKNTLRLGFRNEGFFEKHLWSSSLQEFVDAYQNGMLETQFRTNNELAALSNRLIGRDITRLPSIVQSATLGADELHLAKNQLLEQGLSFQLQNSHQESS